MQIRRWTYRHPYVSHPRGLWPLNIWLYRYCTAWERYVGIGYHWRTVADAHIQFVWSVGA